MASRYLSAFLLLLVAYFTYPNLSAAAAQPQAIKAGYWPTWTFSYSPPSSIDLSLFTHIFYAFIQVDPTTYTLSISANDDLMLSNFSAAIHAHRRRSPVKALLSLGGGDSRSAFAALAADPASRAAFINSTISVASRYGLDGIDLDWEFPSNAKEMADLATLLLEWRAAAGPRLLLTAAVYFAPRFFLSDDKRAYPVAEMASALDWVNAMCYDFHGSWDTSATGAHAALRDPQSNISGSYGVEAWVAAGMPRGKVAMGMPLYGRTWELKDEAENGVGAPAVGVGPGEERGVMVYREIVKFNRENGATVVHDKVFTTAYSYAGTSWIGYDDPWSVEKKVKYARHMGLGGYHTQKMRPYFFWAIGYDQDWSVTRTAWRAWGR